MAKNYLKIENRAYMSKDYTFPTNPKVEHLFMGLIPVLQEWVREQILKPVWNTTDGEAFGRKENYPKMERSIQYDMGHTITITIDLDLVASSIEEGRKAGKMPPTAAIQRWIVVKRVMPKNRQTIAQLNYAIRRAIGRKGTDPKKYLQTQIDKTQLPYAEIDKVVDNYFAAFELLQN